MSSSTSLVLAEPLQSAAATQEDLLGFFIAYTRLLTANYEAEECSLAPKDAPATYPWLREAGVRKDILLWMLYQGHVDHFQAGSDFSSQPSWQLNPSAVVGDSSGFALTPLGEVFAEYLVSKILLPADDGEFRGSWGMLRIGRLTPRYDRSSRLLHWGRHPLKNYRQPSENQELVLLSAES